MKRESYYHELYGEGKHREETYTNPQSNSMVRVKYGSVATITSLFIPRLGLFPT